MRKVFATIFFKKIPRSVLAEERFCITFKFQNLKLQNEPKFLTTACCTLTVFSSFAFQAAASALLALIGYPQSTLVEREPCLYLGRLAQNQRTYYTKNELTNLCIKVLDASPEFNVDTAPEVSRTSLKMKFNYMPIEMNFKNFAYV